MNGKCRIDIYYYRQRCRGQAFQRFGSVHVCNAVWVRPGRHKLQGGNFVSNAEEIAEFCKVNFGVTFPLMAKIDVNGPDASPLYDWMKKEKKGLMGSTSVKWNFTKFLIDREGNVVKRYGPQDAPAQIAKDIEKLL